MSSFKFYGPGAGANILPREFKVFSIISSKFKKKISIYMYMYTISVNIYSVGGGRGVASDALLYRKITYSRIHAFDF